MEFFATPEFSNSGSFKTCGTNSSSDSGCLFGSFAGSLQVAANRPGSSGSLDSITDGDRSSRESNPSQRKANDGGNAMQMDCDTRDREHQRLQVEADCHCKFGGTARPFLAPEDGTKNEGSSGTAPNNSVSRWSRAFDVPSAATARLSVTPAKGRKKRSRAAKRVPTTVLTIDASNFKAMVQQFTGIATKPCTSSANSSANTSANFSSNSGGISLPQPELIFPKHFPRAALAARTNPSRCLTTVDVNPSLINPSAYNNVSPGLITPSLNPLCSLQDAYMNRFLQPPDHHNFLMNVNRLSSSDEFCIYEEQQPQPMSDYISTGFLEDLGLDCPVTWRNI